MAPLFRVLRLLAIPFGVAFAIPAVVEYQAAGALSDAGIGIIAFGALLVIGGLAFLRATGYRMHEHLAPLPPPVRVAVIGNVLVLSFFVLEFSDGVIRQYGRVFYWTSILFLPAVVLLYGLVMGHCWAWWTARAATLVLALWFAVFLVMIPFADLRADGVLVPWWGRVYMSALTLLLMGTMAVAFRALGRHEARAYFGRKPQS